MAKHLLTLLDYTSNEIKLLLKASSVLKRIRRSGIKKAPLIRPFTAALIFEKPSTRTRASMSVAVYELGGYPAVYSFSELQLSRGEPIKDTARVLSRYHDLIAARVRRHRDLEELASFSSVPVVNMLSDMFHPLQALADAMTIMEYKGDLRGLRIAFVGDGRDNVLSSLMVICSKLGMSIAVASPREYWPKEEFLEKLGRLDITLTEEPAEAVRGSDVVYTDVFVSMGQEHERERRLRVFMPKYTVTLKLFELAKEDAIFMHCLPARRGEEVEDAVIEHERSVVFEQAENRLHTAKAVLLYLLDQSTVRRLACSSLKTL